MQFETTERNESERHLRNHLRSPVERHESTFGQSERSTTANEWPSSREYHAVGAFEVAIGYLLQGERVQALLLGVSHPSTYGHGIVLIAVIEHSHCDSGGGMLVVGQNADLLCPLDQCTVELMPWPARKRYDTHIVVRHAKSMSKHLQAVERGIDRNHGIG